MPSEFEQWSKARSLGPGDVSIPQASRFWDRVDAAAGAGCWLWTGYVTRNGYGQLVIGTKQAPRSVLAHRLAHALTVGVVPARAYVLHSCDVRLCCRPAHLSIGSHRENQQQKYDRERQAILAGTDNPRARLNPEVVAEMRATYATLRKAEKKPYRDEISQRYGITDSAVRAALYGENWYLSEGREAALKAMNV